MSVCIMYSSLARIAGLLFICKIKNKSALLLGLFASKSLLLIKPLLLDAQALFGRLEQAGYCKTKSDTKCSWCHSFHVCLSVVCKVIVLHKWEFRKRFNRIKGQIDKPILPFEIRHRSTDTYVR